MRITPLASFLRLGLVLQLQAILHKCGIGAVGALAGRGTAFPVEVALTVVLETPALLAVAPPSVS